MLVIYARISGGDKLTSNDSYTPDTSFSALLITLSSSAWIGLGKIADPLSGEVKKDLKTAKFTIDTLVMLREKTKGNLEQDEEKLLNGIIADLQANYAETVFSGEEKEVSSEKGDQEGKKGEGEKDTSSEEEGSDKKKDQKEKKK